MNESSRGIPGAMTGAGDCEMLAMSLSTDVFWLHCCEIRQVFQFGALVPCKIRVAEFSLCFRSILHWPLNYIMGQQEAMGCKEVASLDSYQESTFQFQSTFFLFTFYMAHIRFIAFILVFWVSF